MMHPSVIYSGLFLYILMIMITEASLLGSLLEPVDDPPTLSAPGVQCPASCLFTTSPPPGGPTSQTGSRAQHRRLDTAKGLLRWTACSSSLVVSTSAVMGFDLGDGAGALFQNHFFRFQRCSG